MAASTIDASVGTLVLPSGKVLLGVFESLDLQSLLAAAAWAGASFQALHSSPKALPGATKRTQGRREPSRTL